MNRNITDNWIWDLYNTSNVKVKNYDNSPWLGHKLKVAAIFNTLTTSETELMPEDTIYESG